MTSISPLITPPQAAVRADHVTVAYGSRIIQRDLDFTIAKGDIFIIMGGSGCGKSSLLRILMGLTPPAKGTVWYGEKDFWGAPATEREAVMRRTGVMFQSGALWTSRTLAETWPFPLNITPTSRPVTSANSPRSSWPLSVWQASRISTRPR